MAKKFLFSATLLVLLATGCTSVNSFKKSYVYQEVYYLTTREDTQSDDPKNHYNGIRGEAHYGVAMVALDPEETQSPFAAAQPNYALRQERLIRRGALQQIAQLEESKFFEEIEVAHTGAGDCRDVLIYIHGYKRDFVKSSATAALLRYELAFPGPVISFSWPSRNSVTGYLIDEENLDWSEPELRGLIEDLAREVPDARIHILAHSMGNQALIKTLLRLIEQDGWAQNWPIREVVMVAPDIDRAIFTGEIAPRLKAVPSRITLYVSSEDFPLIASNTVNAYPRLGDSRSGAPVVEGVQTVDVSDAISMLVGHTYYEVNRETLEDLYYLLRTGMDAKARPTLQKMESGAWRLKATSAGQDQGGEAE